MYYTEIRATDDGTTVIAPAHYYDSVGVAEFLLALGALAPGQWDFHKSGGWSLTYEAGTAGPASYVPAVQETPDSIEIRWDGQVVAWLRLSTRYHSEEIGEIEPETEAKFGTALLLQRALEAAIEKSRQSEPTPSDTPLGIEDDLAGAEAQS